MTDPIADMLSRIRNAIAAGKTAVNLPHSKIKQAVAELLAENGFLQSVKVVEAGGHKQLEVAIRTEDSNAAISEVSRLSTPGRRLYVRADAIPKVKGGRGLVILSTSRGIMTGDQARAKKIGGELICEVY
ncbi:MAG: 30S ribosomal protein S8 [Candidatus Saccharimonadales bacterium]|jgi:small subunit ribosomal protein S8